MNNVRACFNKVRRLFQLFGAGSLKKLSMPPIVSVAPDTWKRMGGLKERASLRLVLDKRTQNTAASKERMIINLKNNLQETRGCCSAVSCSLLCSAYSFPSFFFPQQKHCVHRGRRRQQRPLLALLSHSLEREAAK